MPDALTVHGLLVRLETLLRENRAIADLPVVLASDCEANVACPVASEFGVSLGAYRHVDRGRGVLGGDENNCVVIWPSE